MKAVAVIPKTKNLACIEDMPKPDFNFRRHAGAFGPDEDRYSGRFFRLENTNDCQD